MTVDSMAVRSGSLLVEQHNSRDSQLRWTDSGIKHVIMSSALPLGCRQT